MNPTIMNNMVAIAPATTTYSQPRPNNDIQRKKRTRAKRSCDMCRKKKTRCDADVSQPCTKCKLAGIECQFLVEQKKRGPSTGSYVEILENRLLRMEKLLQNIAKEKTGESGGEDLDNLLAQHRHSPTSCSPQPPRSSFPEEEEENDDEDDEESPHITYPTLLAEGDNNEYDTMQEKMKTLTISDYQRTRYIGASSGVHFLNEELFRTNKKHRIPEEPSWFVQKLNDDEDEHIIMKTKEVMPPPKFTEEFQSNRIEIFEDTPHMTQELADYLVHMYFTRVHLYCPLINKTQFLEQYYFHNPTPPDKYLLFAIASIGTCVFIPDISLLKNFNFTLEQLQETHDALKAKAHKLLSIVYKRSMISTVQTLMLLSMFVRHEDNDDEDTSHWFITGMAIRMAQDLGLHRDCSKWDIPEYEIELRKRIWYAAYLMDRWVAAELGRPVSILDHEFDVELPTPYELSNRHNTEHSEFTPILILEAEAALEQKKPVYSCFLYLVTLSQIAGQVLVGFHSTRAKQNRENNSDLLNILDRNLTNWKLSLPKELEFDANDTSPDIFNAPACVVNMSYNCIWILLYRSFIKHNSKQPENTNTNLAFKALSVCTASATNIVAIVENMERHAFVALPWNMAVYALFQASIIFLHNAKGENTFIKDQGRTYLNRCARVWNHDPYLRKTRVVKVLQQLVKNFEVTMEDDSSYSSNSPPPPSIGNRRKRTTEVMPFVPAAAASSMKVTHPPLLTKQQMEEEDEGVRHNSYLCKVIQSTGYVEEEQEEPVSKHSRIDNNDYNGVRRGLDGMPMTDPFSANFNDLSSTRPEDMFFSSLSFGLGKNTINAIFNLQHQQQQEDLEKRRKLQEQQQQQQQHDASTSELVESISCPSQANPVLCPSQADPILCPSQADPILCPSQADPVLYPNQCPSQPQQQEQQNLCPSQPSSSSFSASTNTTPEVDFSHCPSLDMQQQQPYNDNNNFFNSNSNQQQQQFDLASLSSEIPIWELPSGITWCEWAAFLKTNGLCNNHNACNSLV